MCPGKVFMCPANICTSPVKLMYTARKISTCPLKNHMPCRACNHKSLCAMGQDIHAPGMRARLNVELWTHSTKNWKYSKWRTWTNSTLPNLFTCNKTTKHQTHSKTFLLQTKLYTNTIPDKTTISTLTNQTQIIASTQWSTMEQPYGML